MNDPLLDEFLHTKKAKTGKVYELALRHYMTYTGKSMTELHLEALKDEESHKQYYHREYVHDSLRFIEHLKETRSRSTVNNAINSITGFYKAYRITPPELTRERGDIALEKNFGKLLSRDEIRKMTTPGLTLTWHGHKIEYRNNQYINKLFSYFSFFRSYSNYRSFFRNINIPNYFISFCYFKKVHHSCRYNSCSGSSHIACFCFISHFHIAPFLFLLYIYLYSQYIYFFLFHFIEKYKDLYSMRIYLYIEIYKDLGFRGATFFLPCSPILSEHGETQHGEMVKMERKEQNRFIYYEDTVFENVWQESLNGLDTKLGNPRTCPIKGGMA